ncbi:MAG: hypothetical protein HKN26_10910 [Acidimicrobiales bacterium]|nr:hypothetical protein [Acidimicrobiales bacterium]
MQAHLDERATDGQIERLRADQAAWVESLFRRLDDTEDAIDRARKEVRGPARANILDDLDAEANRIDDVITELIGPPSEPQPKPEPVLEVGEKQLQLSWVEGRLVAWGAGLNTEPDTLDELAERLKAHGGGAIDWEPRDEVELPGKRSAPTVGAPLQATLGWVASLSSDDQPEPLSASARFMGVVAAMAVDFVAQGKIVPQLLQFKGGRKGQGGTSTFHVRWEPALLDPETLTGLIAATPGAAMACLQQQDRTRFVNTVLADFTDAIVRTAASQLEVPAAPPDARTRADVGETLLCRLDGTAFRAPTKIGTDISRKLGQWAQSLSGTAKLRLVIQLDPPDDIGAWHAKVLAPADKGALEPVEVAMTTASKSKGAEVKRQLSRLERLFPPLLRPGGRRRGEVILSQDEAWQLMAEEGELLLAAGYDVRVPPLSKKKPTPSLRLNSETSDSVVGARQLANVSWSAVFDDIELTAAEIAELAAEARPLVQSHGTWIELDKVDLAAAAAALAERADTTKLTGADMLRHALGLEGNPLGGGISIVGDGWAADLLRSVAELPEHPETKPEFFEGELRSYQADALAWMLFLDQAGLGGCLALDMGLGKTPTALAAFALTREHGPGLVVAPPAVVGNWAAEATKFTPDLEVLVHHGANRSKGAKLKAAVRKADLIITTYGTAVRDIDELEKIEWGKVVLDEAQAIKNPAADTSQQLRRLEARTRVALTGTPIENGLGDLWSIMDWANPGLLGPRASFIAQLTPDTKSKKRSGDEALKTLNGILVYRRTKAEPAIAAELPDRIDELDHCAMTPEQIGLYQAVIDSLVVKTEASDEGSPERKGAVLAAITALKQICNHPVNYRADETDEILLDGRSGKLDRLNEILENVFAADERVLIFTHFASWGETLAGYLTDRYQLPVACYHGGLSRGARDKLVDHFQKGKGAGAMVLSLKAGGTGLNLTAANHVVLYDRWWNPAVEDQARDRVWRIGQKNTVICHRLICPGTVDERVEEVVAGKRQIANLVLPKSSSIGDLDADQLQQALGIDPDALLTAEVEAVTADPDPDPAPVPA